LNTHPWAGDAGNVTIEASGPVSFAGLDSDGFGSLHPAVWTLVAWARWYNIRAVYPLEDGAYMTITRLRQGMLAM